MRYNCKYKIDGATLTKMFESEGDAKAFFGNHVTWIRTGLVLHGAPSRMMEGCTEIILEPVHDNPKREEGSRHADREDSVRPVQEDSEWLIPAELGGEG